MFKRILFAGYTRGITSARLFAPTTSVCGARRAIYTYMHFINEENHVVVVVIVVSCALSHRPNIYLYIYIKFHSCARNISLWRGPNSPFSSHPPLPNTRGMQSSRCSDHPREFPGTVLSNFYIKFYLQWLFYNLIKVFILIEIFFFFWTSPTLVNRKYFCIFYLLLYY